MPRLQSFAPLLRPLAAPRAVASRQFLRFSTTSPWQAEQPPPSAKPVAQPSLPPHASSRHPSSPQEAQRAADLAAAESLTEGDSAQPPERKPTDHVAPTSAAAPASVANTTSALKHNSSKKPKAPQAPNIPLPPPKYYVSRSASRNLPIYTDFKRGGNLHLTKIRKITGDLSALRDELRVLLNKKNEEVKINSLTSHVIVKGHHVKEITDFLTARGF